MTWEPQRQRVPAGPNMGETTLRVMGRTAVQTADTPAFREWASRLAARAPSRDYVAQLHELYRGILDRWRYVMESGEWVHGTPRSLIAHVLGTKYDQPNVRPELAVLDRPTPQGKHGFGDCDDVATAVAAGVIAIGMRPLFRVSGPPLHVSVVTTIPDGRTISVDPVGHPKHKFGWAAPSRMPVRLYDMNGNPAQGSTYAGSEAMQGFGQVEYYDGVDETANQGTYFAGPDCIPIARIDNPHVAFVRPSDVRGPRVLAVPNRTLRLLQMGMCPDGACGVDEYGEEYEYDGTRDLWMQGGSMGAVTLVREQDLDDMSDEEFASAFGWGYADRAHVEYGEGFFGLTRRQRRRLRRRKRKARRRARRKRVRAGARRFFRRIGKGLRKVGQKVIAPILRSKWAQRIIGRGLSAIGIPARLTKMFMAAAGSLIKKVGVVGLIKLIRKDRKKALRILAAAGKAGLKAATRLAGVDEDDPRGELLQTWTTQQGVEFPSQYIMGFVGAPGIYGQADIEVEPDPTPGAWYRIQKGDTLSSVARRAYGTKGGANYERMKWINAIDANQYAFDSSLTDNLFPDGRISFRPKFASDPAAALDGESGRSYALIFLPMAPGDEPPVIWAEPEPDIIVPDVPEPPPVLPPEPVEPDVPVPPPVIVEPVEPVEPEPLPPIEPVGPPVPPDEPEPAPDEPDVPEPPVGPDEPEEPERPPLDPRFEQACINVGGRPVYTPAVGWHCEKCPPGQIWSVQAGRCIPHLAPVPEVPDMPDIPTPVPTPTPAPVAPQPTPQPPPTMPPVQPQPGYPAPPVGSVPAAALLFFLLNA